MDKSELITYLGECKQSGMSYREKFRTTWDEVEKQIRCVPPDSWESKESWQTKIYIPLQAKKSEIACAYLGKMLFGKRRSFDITGVEREDSDDAQQIAKLIDLLLQSGDFEVQNNFVLHEAVDLGTGFIKLSMKPDGMGLDFLWRSIYNVVFDPECGHDLDKARFFGDLFRRDIRYVISRAKQEKFGYDRKVVQQFLDDASFEAQAENADSNKEPLMTIKSIDGTQDITIPSKYNTVDVDEWWVSVPGKGAEYDMRRIVLLNGKYILSDNRNEFGFIPYQWCRIKPRKYDSYGIGYMENTRGLQELMNTCVNLGFDSLKISAMDIIVIDDNKVKDSTTIKYKPLAVWKMKDVNAVKIQRQPVSAIGEILKGVTLIDQIDQDASGISRHAQGSPNLSGATAETLGEYQLKMQMIDQRFLDVGRFIENDYLIPLIKKVFKIIINPALYDQGKVNRLLGMKKIDNLVIDDAVARVEGTKDVVKLDLSRIQGKGEMAYDFKAVGVTQFVGRLEIIENLKQALEAALSNPTLTALTKIDMLWKKLWQLSNIDDYDEMIRSPQEAKELLGLSAQQAPQMGQGGIPPMGGV